MGERRQVLRLVNQFREAHDLDRLRLDRHLTRPTRRHSRRMRREGYIFHTPNLDDLLDRFVGEGEWDLGGENVAAAGSARRAFRGWRRSKTHRRNMLSDDFGRIGIGFVPDDEGHLWLTTWFYG